jgi:hypothetical protein
LVLVGEPSTTLGALPEIVEVGTHVDDLEVDGAANGLLSGRTPAGSTIAKNGAWMPHKCRKSEICPL